MDCTTIGNRIKSLRLQNNMTQKQLADALGISDKTVSKWERGCGCPDLSLWTSLSKTLKADMEAILNTDAAPNKCTGGNMKKAKYYVCPTCGNISVCLGEATVSCCSRRLESLVAKKATDEQILTVEEIEDELYITSSHPMEKDNYISFVALIRFDRITMLKQYPEWQLQIRLPKRGRGTLLWYSTSQGLLYQMI